MIENKTFIAATWPKIKDKRYKNNQGFILMSPLFGKFFNTKIYVVLLLLLWHQLKILTSIPNKLWSSVLNSRSEMIKEQWYEQIDDPDGGLSFRWPNSDSEKKFNLNEFIMKPVFVARPRKS